MTRIGVIALLSVLEAVAVLDVVLLVRSGLNPVAFVLVALLTAPWLAFEIHALRRTLAERRPEPAALAPVTPLRPHPSTYTGPVHTAATNPTGKRLAA